MKYLIQIIFLIASIQLSFASDFNPRYMLKLDSTWSCTYEVDSFCIQKAENGTKNIIVWTVKKRGPSDTIENFLNHLRQVKKPKNSSIQSEPRYSKLVSLNGLTWVDSLHWQSELQNHFTRYMATSNDKITALVTFSSPKKNFKTFNKEAESIIRNIVF